MLLVDARVNAMPGAFGLARSVVQLAEHAAANQGDADLDDAARVKVLVCTGRPQLLPLDGLTRHADLVETDIGIGAVHRSAQLSALIRRTSASVLYAPYPVFAPLRCPCPLVVSIHDVTMENDAGFAGGWHRQHGLKLVTGAVLRRAAAVTAPTHASLAGIRAVYPRARRVALVPNGVDARPYLAVDETAVALARGTYRLPTTFMLAVGAHRPHKNFPVLVRALTRLPEEISLVVVGQRDPRFRGLPAALTAMATDLGVASRLRLVPEVTDDLLPAVYRAARLVAFPSVAEGYGLPALEALAAGVPLLVSDLAVFAEVCGEAALRVPPDDPAAWAEAITGILEDPVGAGQRADAGAAIAAQANWQRGGQALRRLLVSVAISAGTRRALS
ncbi:MAG: glycosyltransferase family 4 protein [Actinobacteria bacterium]|nr:glycosyltransferase family 4 protein [Actinomycetota bacterium]